MNIKKTLLYDYVDIARSAGYYVVLVEPKTSWKYNISDLALRNHHKVSEEVLGELLAEFEQIIAVYYGWFLSENSSKALKDGLFGVLNECCTKIPSFKDVHGNNSVQDEHGKFTFNDLFFRLVRSAWCLSVSSARIDVGRLVWKVS